MEILIVEDSASLRERLRRQLGELGHEVRLAVSGEECLHLFESDLAASIDLVLMDIDMPGLNGFETTRLLREYLEDQWVPIFFVTATSDDERFAEGIESGGDDFLAKPVSTVILEAKIKALERITEMQREMNRLNQELEYMSFRDGLTQVFNRRAFNKMSAQLWAEAERRHLSCAVIMLDIDFFKQYNDFYGHFEGDQCLLSVARLLEKSVDGLDGLLARFGGEEFIIFLSDVERNSVEALASRICQTIENAAIEHQSSPLNKVVTVSLGVALSNHLSNHSLKELLSVADQQLYRAKKAGRNRVFVDELDSHKTILIGLDDPREAQDLSAILGPLFNIVTVDNGEECIEIASYIEPDLIVLSPRLSDKDGFRVSSSFKYHENIADVPVLGVGTLDSPVPDVGALMGISGFIKKPFDKDEVQQQIRSFLSSSLK